MKRFLKTLALLNISLFVVVSGVNATLDHYSHLPTQASFTFYSCHGNVVLAYEGDLAACKAFAKLAPTAPRGFLHRT